MMRRIYIYSFNNNDEKKNLNYQGEDVQLHPISSIPMMSHHIRDIYI